MREDIKKSVYIVNNFKQFVNESITTTNDVVKTYGDISRIIKTGKAVRLTTYYNNTITFYIKDETAYRQHNMSAPSYFTIEEDNKVPINPLYDVEILPYYYE